MKWQFSVRSMSKIRTELDNNKTRRLTSIFGPFNIGRGTYELTLQRIK
jgi:hypothetical protein